MTITKLMDDYHVVVGERVEFEIEVSEEGAHVMWSVYVIGSIKLESSITWVNFEPLVIFKSCLSYRKNI